MNIFPVDWTDQLKAVYPQRSGPCGWASLKLMLELRNALRSHTWEQILDGCRNYKAYCAQSGKEGSDFVQTPLRFIADGCYAETFAFQAPQTSECQARERTRAADARRMAEAAAIGGRLVPPLTAYPHESVAAFETRIKLARPSESPRTPHLVRDISTLTAKLKA